MSESEEINDAHSDLGYLKKEELEEIKSSLNSQGRAESRFSLNWREHNMKVLQSLEPTLLDEGQTKVTLSILNRKVEFHLSSNTWFSHAKNQYGYGIERQVNQIKTYLESQK